MKQPARLDSIQRVKYGRYAFLHIIPLLGYKSAEVLISAADHSSQSTTAHPLLFFFLPWYRILH